MNTVEIYSRILFSLFFIFAGINHFNNPSIYDSLVPTYIPYPRFVHLTTGFIEIILGVSLLTKWRSVGALLLAIFLIVIYLANLHMWINDVTFLNHTLSSPAHILRLILQIAMILYSLFIWRSLK